MKLAGQISAATLATASALLPSAVEACAWETDIGPASTQDGHRLRVVFLHVDGRVTLELRDTIILDRVLETPDASTGYSGELQCRVSGRQHITLTAFGITTYVVIDVDEPTLLVLGASANSVVVDVAQTDEPPELY